DRLQARVEELERENANLREFIAASEECAKAIEISDLHEDNERYRAAFKQIVDRVQSGDHTVRNAFCSWCQEAWPQLDGDTAEAAKEYARRHAFVCKSRPLRIERDAARAEVEKMRAVCREAALLLLNVATHKDEQ